MRKKQKSKDNENRDTFLHKLLGQCYHEPVRRKDNSRMCIRCGHNVPDYWTPGFSNAGGFASLMWRLRFLVTESKMDEIVAQCIPFDDKFADRYCTKIYMLLRGKMPGMRKTKNKGYKPGKIYIPEEVK